MEVKWIKLSTELFRNPKIVMIRSEKAGERTVLIWMLLLMLAGRCNRGGRLIVTDNMPYNLKMLSRELGFSEKALEFALEQFVRFNMIIVEDGVYAIKNWEKYQNVEGMERVREQTRKRVAKHRAQRNATAEQNVTECNATEEEREEETEKEKEIEFHSVNHAREDDFDDLDDFVENSVENRKREFLKGTLGQGVVLLSDEQFNDLLNRLSLEEFEKYVGIVRDQELAGKHYKRKTHYQAILDMAEADRRIGPR